MENTLDQDAVNLSKAIRQMESGNRAVTPSEGSTLGGASRYQFTHGTWKKYAKEILGDENAPLSLENENQVAYTKIKKWKDQGYNVGQIASMWNAGEGRPDAYKENWRGTNKYGVKYDTPAYAEKVAAEYHKLKGSAAPTFNPAPFSNPGAVDYSGLTPETPSASAEAGGGGLGKQLLGRTEEAGNAIKDAMSGKINPLSGILQTAGAAAGGLGDVVNAGIELIPGVKAVEKVIGKGVQSFMGTEVGQSIGKALTDFSTSHPELAKDMGAVFNIATALPILKGLSVIKNVTLNASARALERVAERSVAKSLEEAAVKGSFKKATTALRNDKGLFGDMVSAKEIPDVDGKIRMERLLPDIEDGKYATQNAVDTSWGNINQLSDKINDRVSGKLLARQEGGNAVLKIVDPTEVVNNVTKVMPHSGLDGNDLIRTAKQLDPGNTTMWDKFARGEATIDEVNTLRSNLGRKIGSKVFDAPEVTFQKEVGKNLYGALSEYVKKEVPETRHLFDAIKKQFDYQKALDMLNGKKAKSGFLGTALRGSVAGAGELAGRALGTPMIGGYLAYQGAGAAEKRLAGGLPQYILNKAGQRVPASQVKSKIGGLLGSALYQKAASQK